MDDSRHAEGNGAVLGRDAILSADDMGHVPVNVPEWGGSVHVRMLTARQRDAFELWVSGDTKENIRARLAVLCVCDADGKLLFSDDDADALGEKSGSAMDRIFDAAADLNKFSKKDTEELEGN